MATRKRTSIAVGDLIAIVNKRNLRTDYAPARRDGHNSLLETVLHETGNYAGFGYYTGEDLAKAGNPHAAPGIVLDASGKAEAFPDETRRFYYFSARVAKTPAVRKRLAEQYPALAK